MRVCPGYVWAARGVQGLGVPVAPLCLLTPSLCQLPPATPQRCCSSPSTRPFTHLGVCDAPVVQYLQQDVEHVAVRLLHLIKQDDGVGAAPAGGAGQYSRATGSTSGVRLRARPGGAL